MNPWEVLAPAMAIATAIGNAMTELVAGQPVNLPPIRTYFGKLHLEVDVVIKTLPPP